MNIPELPIQVVAVTDAPATNYHHTQELNQVLVAEVTRIITIIIIIITLIAIIIPATNYHHTQELNQVLVAEVITIITVIIIIDLSYSSVISHLILPQGGILTSFSFLFPPLFH